MNKQLLKDTLLWGIGLWFVGYVLGFVFFAIAPKDLIGWVIMPIGIAVTLWVLFKKVKGDTIKYYLTLAISWTIIAVVFDYFFLVKALKPADGYYKLDVYIYYALTFLLPFLAGFIKTCKRKSV